MAVVEITKKDSFQSWVDKTNEIPEIFGDLDNLTTTVTTSLVDALNSIVASNSLSLDNIVEDTTPELGSHLDLNNNNINGTGNINITGEFVGTLDTSVTGITQDPSDTSTKIATTEWAETKVASLAPSITFGGDLSGASNNVSINANTVGSSSLGTESGGNVQEFLVTDGLGTLSFININDFGGAAGGDLSGGAASIEINSNTVGINELNLVDGSANHIITTDGAGTITFKPSVTLSSVSPNVGDQTFNINYNVGGIVVYLNGIKLVNGVDFTANNGSSVVLTSAIGYANQIIDFQRYSV